MSPMTSARFAHGWTAAVVVEHVRHRDRDLVLVASIRPPQRVPTRSSGMAAGLFFVEELAVG